MPENNLPAVQYYTPVELVGIYRSFLERGCEEVDVYDDGFCECQGCGYTWRE